MARILDPALVPGATLDERFRLVREIASGAMGAVWEAIDLSGRVDAPAIAAGSRVALKVLRPELHSEPSIRRRFRREASILQSISHPAVVRILDLGTGAGERSYTVMELLHGETLEARLARDGRLAPRALAPLVRAIAEGLAAVHAHGVIHGDLKPSNVFLAAEGSSPAKIVDFGLSKIEGLERLTRTGELTGTPAYMAPELLTGAGELDARIDQYALGVVLHQALAGRLPFQLNKHPGALMFDIVMGKGTPLEEAAPDVAPAVREVVARAMAPKRDARYADVLALAAAFEEASAGAR
ncbi:MAG: serine/threonine protein kinase [Myxococcota bacterium]|nr:serine/threonine protein kinase [Myxococcota bacterium]